ncbi:MAG: hypothetical protein WBO58_05255 [Gammaproteobacteria bacterium]
MRAKILPFLLIVSIPISAGISVRSIYSFNEIIQASHNTSYSLEEETNLLDQMIEKADKNEIEGLDLVRIFKSQKKTRIAAHDVMNSSNELSIHMIATLILLVIVQMCLLFLYMKKCHEK